MIASVVILYLAIFSLLGCFLVANSAAVLNSVRYMAVAPGVLWLDRRYTRFFPNFLKLLYDAGFTSPWPARPTTFAAWKFRRRFRSFSRMPFPMPKS